MMKSNILIRCFVFVLICFIHLSGAILYAQHDVVKDGDADAYNLNKPEREEWLQNTGSGMFIHFGVDAQLGIVISHSLVGASDDYQNRYFKELPKTFNPSRFDPDYMATLAKLAGMKYIMFTTKHHSGFCMWDTQTTDFNIMHTPYAKDLLKAFVEATRRAGLGVGFYFSPEDFYFLHQHHLPISRDSLIYSEAIRKEYDDYNRKQCEELMTNYGKIDLLFIDGMPKEVVKETCWKLQPDILITRGALKTPEQMLPGVTINEPWLSCITMGSAWQYQPTNERYKSGTQLIELLIEARSKGGSLLLNIGPKASGDMPDEQDARLREMAAWYFINQEAIDSTRAWVIPHEKNIWYTTSINQKNVYAFVTGMNDWKEGDRNTFLLRSVKGSSQTKISVLGQSDSLWEYHPGADVQPRVTATDSGLLVSVVRTQRIYDDHRWPNPVVIKIENVQPAIHPLEVQTGEATSSGNAVLLTGKIFHYSPDENVTATFLYRPYANQIEDLYSGEWLPTKAADIHKDGTCELPVDNWKGDQYEYKCVITYHGIQIEGDKKLWKRKK